MHSTNDTDVTGTKTTVLTGSTRCMNTTVNRIGKKLHGWKAFL